MQFVQKQSTYFFLERYCETEVNLSTTEQTDKTKLKLHLLDFQVFLFSYLGYT